MDRPEEVAAKLERVRALMVEEELEAVVQEVVEVLVVY